MGVSKQKLHLLITGKMSKETLDLKSRASPWGSQWPTRKQDEDYSLHIALVAFLHCDCQRQALMFKSILQR